MLGDSKTHATKNEMQDSLTNFIRQGDKIDIHREEEKKKKKGGEMTTITCVR